MKEWGRILLKEKIREREERTTEIVLDLRKEE